MTKKGPRVLFTSHARLRLMHRFSGHKSFGWVKKAVKEAYFANEIKSEPPLWYEKALKREMPPALYVEKNYGTLDCVIVLKQLKHEDPVYLVLTVAPRNIVREGGNS